MVAAQSDLLIIPSVSELQCEVVTPSAAAIRKADRQILMTLPDGGDHDERDFAFRVAANLATQVRIILKGRLLPILTIDDMINRSCIFDAKLPSHDAAQLLQPRHKLSLVWSDPFTKSSALRKGEAEQITGRECHQVRS